MDIKKLNELYDFKNGEMIEKVMNHPLLKKDKSEWSIKEMMEEGLVERIGVQSVPLEGAYEGISRVWADLKRTMKE